MSARRRGYSFDITQDDFLAVVRRPCFYCGESEKPRGVDRFDNKVGYTVENSRSCCWPCNDLKGTLTPEQFSELTEHAALIASHIAAVEHMDCLQGLPK